MSLANQKVENFQNQKHCLEEVDDHCNEEERELEEALSLSDLPISAITSERREVGATEGENTNAGENLEGEFDFGSLVGSMSTLDGEMCAADEVFSGGQILPYRNSVSSISGLRSVSRSDSMDQRRFGSRSSSSRSSSIRSHYSNTSSSSCSSSNNTTISTKTVPLVTKAKVQNQFHSYPSPKPQILGSSMQFMTCTTPGRKSKMWEVLKLGLVRTPEIELQDLKQRHRTNNYGKTIMTIPRNNSSGSNSSSGSITKASSNQNTVSARKSCSNDGNKITNDFILEAQKRRKNQILAQNKNDDSGFFKSCKCSIGAIEPMPSIRSSYNGVKSSGYYFESSIKLASTQNKSNSLANQVLNEDKNLAQKKVVQLAEEQQQKQRRNKNNNHHHLRQGKQVMMSHHNHHHRTFEWLKNLSHASVLNN